MILSGPRIEQLVGHTRECRERGLPLLVPGIDIEPWEPSRAGSNSYDVTLANKFLVYDDDLLRDDPYGPLGHDRRITGYSARKGYFFDPTLAGWVRPHSTREEPKTRDLTIPDDGIMLVPGRLYLGSTVERVSAHGLVPWIDGRSSGGRLGISVHVTAGRGDDAFDGNWTLEITVVHSIPVWVFPGDRLGQVTFFELVGERRPYAGRYAGSTGPVASRMSEGSKS